MSLLLIAGATFCFAQDMVSPTGLKYKFITKGDAANPLPELTDMVTMVAFYHGTNKDTIFFDSRKSSTPYIFPVLESVYKGDIYEGIRMMRVGDSICFTVSADSLFLKSFRSKMLPPYVKPGSMVNVYMTMKKIQKRDAFQKEMQAKMEADSKKANAARSQEDSLMKIYLKANKISTAPLASGLIFVEKVKGTGAKAEAGKSVSVHYTGRLLNGTKFDSSLDRGQPISFELGKGMVIPGWDEGIAKMSKGGKATLIIPSKLGYGERGSGSLIPAYSTLVFDVELVDVK
ncbi:MAG: FKBP-type peptidyl-prolyl cis-trans isomerase [Bacteroidota bacterium]